MLFINEKYDKVWRVGKMDLYDAIYVRKSIRNYSKELVGEKLKQQILEFAANLFPLNENKICYKIIERGQLKKMPSLFCLQAPYYLTIYSEFYENYEVNAGYVLQQIALYMVTKGLGCCFIGEIVSLETIPDMIPVLSLAFGFAKTKNIYREEEKADRLSMKNLCTIKEETTPEILKVLQAARLAPSSFNSQPWRFVVYQNRVHIFCRIKKGIWNREEQGNKKIGRMDKINMGIMLSNFLLVSEQLWLETELVRLENIAEQEVKNNQYFLSVKFL